MIAETELYMGVPLHLVKSYAQALSHVSGAMQSHATTRDPVMRYILERSMLVLQGRLEGIGLAWYMWCNDAEQEDALRIAAISYASR